jgi:hypothetical protein
MSHKTALKCPHCEKVGYTTQKIPKGAKVRCSRCDRDFRFEAVGSDENHPEEELRTIGDTELRILSEFFDPEEQRAPALTGDNSNRGRTEEPFTRNPLAPASERSKDSLIGGKPIHFYGSRNFMACVLVVALAGLVYLCFVGLTWVSHEVDTASKKSTDAKKKIYAGDGGSKPPAKSNDIVIQPPKSVHAQPRTDAGTPIVIGDIEVCVVRALEGILNPSQTDERLAITVSVRNVSKRPYRYHRWSDPASGLLLRDQTPSSTKHALIEPATQPEVTIEPGDRVEDILLFLPTPRLYGLNLDLPVRNRFEEFRFQIPREFIERTR